MDATMAYIMVSFTFLILTCIIREAQRSRIEIRIHHETLTIEFSSQCECAPRRTSEQHPPAALLVDSKTYKKR